MNKKEEKNPVQELYEWLLGRESSSRDKMFIHMRGGALENAKNYFVEYETYKVCIDKMNEIFKKVKAEQDKAEHDKAEQVEEKSNIIKP